MLTSDKMPCKTHDYPVVDSKYWTGSKERASSEGLSQIFFREGPGTHIPAYGMTGVMLWK